MTASLKTRLDRLQAAIPPPLPAITERSIYMGPWDGVEWAEWLIDLFPDHFTRSDQHTANFAPFHEELWAWAESVDPHISPDPFLGIWYRFGGKSTNAEAVCVRFAWKKVRNYGLYISSTQAQADDHVQNVAAMLESRRVAARMPQLSERLVGKYNNSKGWRINRLRTQSGFTLDAIGLDKAMRGAKLEDQRPDFMVFDDIDDQDDTPRTVEKKDATITRKILPAGAHNLAVLGVQNLIHSNGIFSRLLDGRADFLQRRIVSGPFPLLQGMTFDKDPLDPKRATITGGHPTWSAYGIEEAQAKVEDIGFKAFRIECQHETAEADGLFLEDVWYASSHVVAPFAVPATWYIDRSYDWGKAKPWGCVWWAMADGETPIPEHNKRIYPKGSLFAIRELYGWTGEPNQGNRKDSTVQAKEIKAVEQQAPWGQRVKPGPADNSIWDVGDDDDSIANRMKRAGVDWKKSDKSPGSRVNGADKIVEYLHNATRTPQEGPGLYIVSSCKNIIRTFPQLQCDPLKDGDVDTDGEDHLWDLTRYRVLAIQRRGPQQVKRGGR